MKKRLLACALAAVFTLALLAGCSRKSESPGPEDAGQKEETGLTEVTLNEVAHSIFYAPMYAAVEEGYFAEEGIDLDLVCGFGADKTMTAVISGEADTGFMGSEASIYTYNEGATDYVVNFAQLTQRAGNFLVAREEMPDFRWEDLKGSVVLGGRKGGMPEMVFEYILKQNGIDPRRIWRSTRILISVPQRLHLPKARENLRLNSNPARPHWNPKAKDMWSPLSAKTAATSRTPHSAQRRALSTRILRSSRDSPMLCRRAWTMSRLTPRKKSPKSSSLSSRRRTWRLSQRS